MIKIAICDDDEKLTIKLESILVKYSKQNGIRVDIDIFFDGQELIDYIRKENLNYDLVFLDIEMKELSGMNAARVIRESNQIIKIIFVTSHTNYAVEAYDVHPYQFIVKPLDENIVTKYFQQVYNILTNGEFYFEYQCNKSIYRIMAKNIMYFESDKRKIRIYLIDGTYKEYYDRLNLIQKKMDQTKMDFWRIHQSFLVNSRYIIRKAYDHVELTNGKIISVSEDKRAEINARYINTIDNKVGMRSNDSYY